MSQSINFFVAYTAQELRAGTAVSTLVLDRITTLTGETIETSDFSTLGRGVLTINPKADGLTNFPESVEFTGVTAATKTLIGVTRGLDKDGSADNTLMRYHPVGTEVILSFGAHQIQDLIDYVNSLVVTTRSVVFEGVAGETISAGDLIYLDDTDNEWKLCDADTPATVENVMLGIAQGAGVDGGNIATGILVKGHDTTNTGLTQGQKYYASNTPGEISNTPGTTEVTIGYGSATGNLYFQPRFDQQITEDEQDALQGTSGIPSANNRYLTEASLGKLFNVFGDGSDSALTFDGTSTVIGLVPAANVYTLTRDVFATNLTVNSGVTINTNGYRLFATGTFTNNGTVDFSGNDGTDGADGTGNIDGTPTMSTGGTGGAGLNTGTVYGSSAGADGGDGDQQFGGSSAEAGATGATETAVSEGVGVAGGAGGSGGGGFGGSGGAAGAAGSITNTQVNLDYQFTPLYDYNGLIRARGTSGAGGGGGVGYNGSGGSFQGGGGAGGGAGSNGGTIVIGATTLLNEGSISANGGNGGNGGDGAAGAGAADGGGGGGGAGGNGGLIVLIYQSYTNNGSVTVNGGTAGTGGISITGGGTAGSNGTAGAAGAIYQHKLGL